MIIYVDENIPSALADGLNVLQDPINVKKNRPFSYKITASGGRPEKI